MEINNSIEAKERAKQLYRKFNYLTTHSEKKQASIDTCYEIARALYDPIIRFGIDYRLWIHQIGYWESVSNYCENLEEGEIQK